MDRAALDNKRFDSLSKEELIALVVQLFERVAALEEQNKALMAQLAQNSRNSSQPPSSDGYQKAQPKSQRGKSGRPSGGQPGHPGRTLKQVAHPDHIEVLEVKVCTQCGFDLSTHGAAQEVEVRQVFDLPQLTAQVREYRARTKECPCCGTQVKAAFPPGVTQPVQYGARLQAAVTYCSQYQWLPYERLQALFHDLFQVDVSQGTVDNVLKRGYGKLEEFERRIKEQIIDSAVAHFDETGLRVIKSLNWLHVAATDTLTAYHIDAKRGEPAMHRMGILPRFAGTAVHDHWASYYRYDCQHALCNAHHLRELTFAEEEHQQHWAAQMRECLLEANAAVIAAKARGATRLAPARREYFSMRYSRILRQGRAELPQLPANHPRGKRGRIKQHKIKNLHDRLKNHKNDTLAFLYNFSVPFTNNQGEQDIRMTKVKQKISGCFRSMQGARVFARVRGCISTVKKQGHNVFEALTALFEDPMAFTRRLTEPIV